jgi:allantoin racemase
MAHRIAILGTGYRAVGGIERPREIGLVAAAGFQPELVETRFGAFPKTPYDRGLTCLGYIDAGIEAERAGYHALFLNTFGDYGIAELRSALSIPVIGAGEAAISVAATLGRRFAIVSIWPRTMNFIFDERIAATGMGARCAGIHNVMDDGEMETVTRGDADNPVAVMRAGSAAIVDRIVAAAELAIARDGAEVIILGCTCMAPVGQAVAARVRAPVVEAMTAGYKMAELLVSLRLTQSAIAYPRAGSDRLHIIGDLISGAAAPVEEDCEICVFATDQAAE